jgi:light-regulated signal transduction histidine kinase (bacteriophytochrome)
MSETTINLSQCDREPIHVPASIQPHGILLVVEIGSLRILQVAGETDRILTRSINTIRDYTIAELLGSHAATLVASAQATSEPVYLGSVTVAEAKLCLTDTVQIPLISPA